jgi:hypothetical protein
MNTSRRSWRAYAAQDQDPKLLPGLVELLLDLLLKDVPDGRSAELTVQAPGETSQPPAESDQDHRYARLGDPSPPGRLVTASAPLTGGGTVTLAVRGELADDEPTQARLRRFLRPMVACVALEHRLNEQAGQARNAVAQIEHLAITDLATGIVMAQRDCAPAKARQMLAGWSDRTGYDLQTLPAARILELLTADPA